MVEPIPSHPRDSFADQALLEAILTVTRHASEKILSVLHRRSSRTKADGSMVTGADEAAEEIILDGLARLMPGVPLVSEEAECRSSTTAPMGSQPFVLIDPLDGTKEYISGRDEFTVNIGLIRGGRPVAGVVTAPALDLAWYGIAGAGAWRRPLTVVDHQHAQPISTRQPPQAGLTAVLSLSHPDDATRAFVDRLPVQESIFCGSSVKFCRIAEGTADVYPRFGRTCEWDVAAGHAVLLAAGGEVYDLDGNPMCYGGQNGDFHVQGFIAWGNAGARADIPSKVL